jgi:hypothetical protein
MWLQDFYKKQRKEYGRIKYWLRPIKETWGMSWAIDVISYYGYLIKTARIEPEIKVKETIKALV